MFNLLQLAISSLSRCISSLVTGRASTKLSVAITMVLFRYWFLMTCLGTRRSHLALSQVYMAKVDDATKAVGSDASWFKVAEIGLPSSNPDYWGTGT